MNPGLGLDASSWLVSGDVEGITDNKPLPLRLVDSGYDVWMTNFRGTKYSRGHTTHSIDSLEYWDFSFAHKGEFDIKANVELIQKHNGGEKIFIVGTSAGTTAMMYALSTDLEETFFADKVHSVIAIAPCTIT